MLYGRGERVGWDKGWNLAIGTHLGGFGRNGEGEVGGRKAGVGGGGKLVISGECNWTFNIALSILTEARDNGRAVLIEKARHGWGGGGSGRGG